MNYYFSHCDQILRTYPPWQSSYSSYDFALVHVICFSGWEFEMVRCPIDIALRLFLDISSSLDFLFSSTELYSQQSTDCEICSLPRQSYLPGEYDEILALF